MIPTDLEQRGKMIRYMLNGLETDADKMSEWEIQFFTSVKDQFDAKGNLSDRQCETLENIYNKLAP